MPFVGTQRSKDLYLRKVLPDKQGDICCLAYTPMVEKWLANPSWTTSTRIHKDVLNGDWHDAHLLSRIETINPLKFDAEDLINAVDLAWQVFFNFYVLHYERKKFVENGGVIDYDH